MAMEFHIREATDADLAPERGLYDTLTNLTTVGSFTHAQAKQWLHEMHAQRSHLFIAVTNDNTIIGCLTLLVERKLIHAGGLVGHIEDVATRKGYEGKGIGKALVHAAVAKAKLLGCYKVILDCNEEKNKVFYEKCGFHKHEICMRIDL